MSKYFHAGLVLLYVLITALAFLVMLELLQQDQEAGDIGRFAVTGRGPQGIGKYI
jgi:hypothetical protein